MNQIAQQPAKASPKITLLPVNPDDKIAQWDGQSSHKDGIIAVIGYEDYLQNILMCRFLKEIKNHFSKVYLLVPRVLVDLLQNLEGCDGIYEFEGEVPKVTHHITLVEGLKQLSLSADGEPYIKLDDPTIERWKKRIPDRPDDHDGLRVGLVWDFESAMGVQKLNDLQPNEQPQPDNRLNFLLMSNFLRLPEHEFYSLQIGAPAARNHIYNFADKHYFVDLFPYITDFNEMAGAISRLDLVVAGDSAAAHLAAAMGCNVWLLSSQEQAWYWQLEAKQIAEQEQQQPALEEGQVRTRGTMWYKSMQLILQEKQGDWAAPLQILMNNLAKLRRKPQDGSGDAKADSKKKGKKKA